MLINKRFSLSFMKYVAYVRKSTDDKRNQVQSIPNQLDWVKKASDQLGVDVLKTFTDKKTASEPGREGFGEMMQLIQGSQDPVGILCWKMHRLARNPIDEGAIKYAFIKGSIKHIYASDRQFREGDNQILMGVEFGAATQYSIDLKSSVEFGMNRKIKGGYRPGCVPLGYLNDPYGIKGERKIFTDPKRFDLLQNAWKKLLTGAHTVEMIRNQLNAQGFTTKQGKTIKTNTLHRLFRNPFYTGYFLWRGELYQGKHRPMLSMAEFEVAQMILEGKGRGYYNCKNEKTYNGLIRCGECSYQITSEFHSKRLKKTGKTKTYCYMRCSKSDPKVFCSQKYLRKELFEQQVESILSQMVMPQVFIEWFFNLIRKYEKVSDEGVQKRKSLVQKQYNDTILQIENLVDNLNSGIIDSQTYEKTRQRYFAKSNALKRELLSFGEPKENWIEKAYKDFCFARSAIQMFVQGGKNDTREIMMRIGSNWTLKDRKVLVELYPQFVVITKAYNLVREYFPLVEPSSSLTETALTSAVNEESSIWWSLGDELRTFYCNL